VLVATNSRLTKSGAGRLVHISFSGNAKASSAAHTTHARVAHQSGNALAAGHNARVLQFRTDAWHAVGGITGDKGFSDLASQRCIGLLFNFGGLVSRGELLDLVTDGLQVRIQCFFEQATLLGIETLRLRSKLQTLQNGVLVREFL
jgi:hypothetical protein